MNRVRKLPLPLQMTFALVLGVALSIVGPRLAALLEPVGTAFVQTIRMVVIPIVFSMVTLGIYKMGRNMGQLGRVSVLTFSWFLVATLLSIIVALSLNALFHPGAGAGIAPTGAIPHDLALSVDWTRYFLDLIPSNILAVMVAEKVLPTLIFAVLFGLALASIGERAQPIIQMLESLSEAMFRLTKWIIALAPLAVFAIVAWLLATQGGGTLVALAKLIGLMYLGLAIIVVIFWGVLWVLGERPFKVTLQVLEPVLLAFATRSSEIALPRHIEKLREMGAPESVTSVVLPLGYSFNLDGSSMYLALACAFLAEAYGLNLDAGSMATILLTTLIASKGMANVPSGCLVALATVLTSIGLPVEAIAIIAGIDVFMDMGRTAINVFGNTVAVILVQKYGGATAVR